MVVTDAKSSYIVGGTVVGLLADVSSYSDYYAFGMTMPSRNYNSSGFRYGFNGMEQNPELNGTYTTEFRQYDSRLGRWFSIDPKFKASESPYAWVTNNPICYADPLGLDSAQRAKAVEKAMQYVNANTKPGKSQYVMGAKTAEPGKGPIDCSGLITKSVKAGGEEDPNRGNETSGVLNIQKNSMLINDQDLKPGYLITFYRSEGGYPYHVGMLTDVVYNEDNVATVTFAHSEGGYGPKTNTFTIGDGSKYDQILFGFYKWDTKPDYDLAGLSDHDRLMAQSCLRMISCDALLARLGTVKTTVNDEGVETTTRSKPSEHYMNSQHQQIQQLNEILQRYGQSY